jgi:hypothetical protein
MRIRMADRRSVWRTAPVRKGLAALRRIPRAYARVSSGRSEYEVRPPVIVNSLPKSGTHLLMQVALALPGYTTYGTFIATTPSLTMHRRSDAALARRVMQLAPGEVCGAHLYFSEGVREAIARRGAVSLFIYRDPREVFWSEMQYLLTMNRWHRGGRVGRHIVDPLARFEFFLKGHGDHGPFEWPAFADRVKPYLGWLDDGSTFSCRYEDFRSPKSVDEVLDRLATYLRSRVSCVARYERDDLVGRFRAAIRPEDSHTFRSGRGGEWRAGLSPAQREALEHELAGVSQIFARSDDESC